MRKPRDIDAELKALANRAKTLKARKVTQLGELVIATGAGDLEPEVLAGLILTALEDAPPENTSAWGRKGSAFFQGSGQGRSDRGSAGHPSPSDQDPGPGSPGPGDQGAV